MSGPDTRPMRAFALACVIGAAVPPWLIVFVSMKPPPAGPMLFLSGLGIAAAGLGVVTCVLAFWVRRSVFPIPLGLLLLMLGAPSVSLFGEGLDARASEADHSVCLRAERAGEPIPRGERGYRPRRDQDGDGLACEPVLGPGCYEGRCAPFG